MYVGIGMKIVHFYVVLLQFLKWILFKGHLSKNGMSKHVSKCSYCSLMSAVIFFF